MEYILASTVNQPGTLYVDNAFAIQAEHRDNLVAEHIPVAKFVTAHLLILPRPVPAQPSSHVRVLDDNSE